MEPNIDIDEKYREIPYDIIEFPDELKKLLKKISSLRSIEVNKLTIGNTLGDILDLDDSFFSNIDSVGKIYSRRLLQLKKNISDIPPILVEAYKKHQAINNISDVSSFYNLPCSVLSVSEQYAKLINRIKKLNRDPSNHFTIKETVAGIANLDTYQFSQVDGIGRIYINALNKLKIELPTIANSYKDELFKSDAIHDIPYDTAYDIAYDIPYDLSYCFLNKSLLSKEQIRVVEKFEKLYKKKDIKTLLTVSIDDLTHAGGFGKKYITYFYSVKNLIQKELHDISEGVIKLDFHHRSLLVYSKYFDIPLKDIDQILLDDIETYLFSLNEQSQDIAQSRWGFHHQLDTLDEIGFRYNISRERIRQIESLINQNISQHIRIHSKVLSQNIRENLTSDLNILLPNLHSCFENNHSFYNFIEILCLDKSGTILNIQEPEVNLNLLNLFFCENTSPINYEKIITELTSNYGYSKSLAINTIRLLETKSRLKITNEGVFPINLGRKEAAAHALLDYPNGLPWKDVARIANKAGYCKTGISEERLVNKVFADSDFVYQSDRGAYKHIKYFDITNIDIPFIANEVVEYFKSSKKESIHLNDFYHQSSKYTKSIDYFDIRL